MTCPSCLRRVTELIQPIGLCPDCYDAEAQKLIPALFREWSEEAELGERSFDELCDSLADVESYTYASDPDGGLEGWPPWKDADLEEDELPPTFRGIPRF